MKTLSTQPYKGARDFYPDDMAVRTYIFNTWRKIAIKYGFEEYDFPIIEPWEIFASKTGEEIVNEQLFWFEDKGGRRLAVRPELTPGTVRMIAKRYNELPKPLKWFMIGNNWRFEKPQKGRGREFYQLELNTFGIGNVWADFEIFNIIIDIMKAFGADEKMFQIKISDRRIINALLSDYLQLKPEVQIAVRRIMDKRLKVTKDVFFSMLKDTGLNDDEQNSVEAFLQADFENIIKVIPQKVIENNEGYKNLKRLFELITEAEIQKYCIFDPSIIRGFDYSDGLVYEVFDQNPENRRSMFGGERFDKLINIFGNFEMPATGFAMGDYTLLEFFKSWNLTPKLSNPTELYFVTLDEIYLNFALNASRKLREAGINVRTSLEILKLDKQLKFANQSQIKYVAIVGEDEAKDNSISLKNMQDGTQKKVSIQETIKVLLPN